jgi:diguanylate cyclase (GGDEF)-like protein
MTLTHPRPARAPGRLLVLALLLAPVLAFGMLPRVLGLDEPQTKLWFFVGLITVPLLAGLSCRRAAARSEGSDRKAWRSFKLGCLLWVFATVVWASYGWLGAVRPIPSLADLFFSLTSVAFMFGIFHYSLPGSGGSRIQITNFALAIVAVLAVASALYFPFMNDTEIGALGELVAISYPVQWLGTFVFCLICYFLYVQEERAFPFLIILGGVGSAAVADIFYGFDLLNQSYSIGSFYNMLWLASFALLAWAALEHACSRETAKRTASRNAARIRPGEALIPALSVAAVLSASVTAEWDLLGAASMVLVPVVIAFAALLGLREYSLFTTERTLRAQAEETARQLAESEAQLSGVLENTTDGVLVLDREFRITFANTKAVDLLFPDRPYLGIPMWQVPYASPDNVFHKNYRIAFEQQVPMEFEAYFPPLNLWFEDHVFPTSDSLTIFFRDVTERRRLREHLVRLSRHDPLTGLANRAVFGERLALGLESGRRHADLILVLIDLDGFKAINDTMGHLAGDELLQQFARRLTVLVRKGDTVARFGGDEFAIIQPGPVGPEGGAEVARRIFEALQTPFDIQGSEVTLAASIGIAVSPRHGTKPDELVLNADLALYRAKSSKGSGLNCCVFEPGVDDLSHAPRLPGANGPRLPPAPRAGCNPAESPPSGGPHPSPPPRGGREQKIAPSLPFPLGGGAGGGVRLANTNLNSSRASQSKRNSRPTLTRLTPP